MPIQTVIRPLALSLLFLVALFARADNEAKLDDAWKLIDRKECDSARNLFTPPIASAKVMCIYSKSVCCSDINNLKNEDVGKALDYLKEASDKLGGENEYMARWIDDVIKQCHEVSTTLAGDTLLTRAAMITERENRAEVWSHYKGKVTSHCNQDNLSPTLLPAELPSAGLLWHYVAPRFGQAGADLAPSDDFLQAVLKDYVGKEPDYRICAPFIAVSSAQDPGKICEAAHRFTDYFVSTYTAGRPPTWITLYHYPPGGGQLKEHAERTTGKIHCENVLGFFDWRRQSIVFRAPENFFGTFRHELTHALMFWDMPIAPRWLEEGFAAMYEHTDSEYRSLENPWREQVLKKNSINMITLSAFTDKVLSRSMLEFEADPLGATISREVMRKLQECGDLPGLYRALRDQYRDSEILDAFRIEPHDAPADELVQSWQAELNHYSQIPDSHDSCLQ